MRPLIAVTTTSGTAGRLNLPQVLLGEQYVRAVERQGGVALLVTPAHEPEAAARILDLAHGLVLTGGEDVDPSRYGQKPHPRLGEVNDRRDAVEFAVLQRALARRMPVLAICRGAQVLNVALGGTLYQDLPSQRPGQLVHQQQQPPTYRTHAARVQPGSALHTIFGADELFINSYHHQAVERLARGLRATVWAEDGLIEGVEAEGYPWVIGVQWHPERGDADVLERADDPDFRLFRAFVTAASSFTA